MRISGPCPMKVLHNKGLMGTHKIARQHGILHGRLWEPLASWLACLPSDSHGYPERRSGKYFLSFQELSRCHAPNAARNLFKIGQRKSRNGRSYGFGDWAKTNKASKRPLTQ